MSILLVGRTVKGKKVLTDVPGVSVGQYTDLKRGTGCTVVLFDDLSPAAVDVAGGAPGTRETDLLGMGRLVGAVDAVVLAGGSAFGLAASQGVMEYLRAQGRGFRTPAGPVPIVVSAVIYDLDVGDPRAFPGPREGELAARMASSAWHSVGTVGAGTGALVGRFFGPSRAVKGGLGAASCPFQGGTVAVLAVVNSLGNVVDIGAKILAGARAEDGSFMSHEVLTDLPPKGGSFHTVLTVAVTDLAFGRDALAHMARSCSAGVAQAVAPCHTLWDGDVAFAVSTGKAGEPPSDMVFQLGPVCSQLTVRAIRDAVGQATGIFGVPSINELRS